MKIVFMGTPQFAATILEGLYESGEDIVAVYTQPDKAAYKRYPNKPSTNMMPVRRPISFNMKVKFSRFTPSSHEISTKKRMDVMMMVIPNIL